MAKMVDASTLWTCETCFYYRTGECSPAIWCENGEVYRPDYNKLVFIEAEPVKHGKWIISSDGYYPYCSECHFRPEKYMTNFCPNCGAKMDAKTE